MNNNIKTVITVMKLNLSKLALYRFHLFFLSVAGLQFISIQCQAQLNPYQATYFQNRYLDNPSMAGLDKGLNINLGYMQQWVSFPGAPQSQSLTAEYHADDKVGLGIIINNSQEGIFRQTRIMGTYAYHLPLDDDKQKLNFGLSFGVNDPRLNYSAINGDLSDNVLSTYSFQKPYADGDLGLSYTSNDLIVSVAFPNLSTNIFNREGQRQDVDRTVFFTTVSYKISLDGYSDDFCLIPLAGYRGVKGFDRIIDAGLDFKMNLYHLDAQAIYHSNNNFALGVVFNQDNYALNIGYNIDKGPISSYTNGTFEIGLKLKLFQ